jgi:hypothetical protein
VTCGIFRPPSHRHQATSHRLNSVIHRVRSLIQFTRRRDLKEDCGLLPLQSTSYYLLANDLQANHNSIFFYCAENATNINCIRFPASKNQIRTKGNKKRFSRILLSSPYREIAKEQSQTDHSFICGYSRDLRPPNYEVFSAHRVFRHAGIDVSSAGSCEYQSYHLSVQDIRSRSRLLITSSMISRISN